MNTFFALFLDFRLQLLVLACSIHH